MSEQEAFHRVLAANPDDATARLVYADWLDEQGQHEPAARLRWWAGLLTHPHDDAHKSMGTGYGNSRRIPLWARHLVANHAIRSGVLAERGRSRGANRRWNDMAAGDLARGELYGLGLGEAPSRPERPAPAPRSPHGRVTSLYDGTGGHEEELRDEYARAAHYAGVNPVPVSPEKPVKLAAIQPPGSPQPTVTVKLPSPIPVPQAAPAPPKPKVTGPTMIFPG